MIHFFDIIVLLLVVLAIFYKLKSLLGTRPDGFKPTKLSDESASKIFDIILKEAQKSDKEQEQKQEILEAVNEEDLSETDKLLTKIPNFNKEKFIIGAKRAFEIIITAFSKGDTQTLELLVNKNLIKKFQEIIEQRKNDGIISETEFIGFENAEIVDAKLSKSNVAKICVKFISEQVNILKDNENNIIEGDPNYIQNITDIWTFERSITSTNPTWLLVSTKK